MVLSGQFSDDKPWSIRELAKHFRMSVVPVFGAIKRLEQEGILKVSPQRGIGLNKLSAGQVRQANVVREGLEVQAARILARENNAAKIDKLRQLALRIRKLVQEGKLQDAGYMDYEFHRKLFELADCAILEERYNQIATICLLSMNAWDRDSFDEDTPNAPLRHMTVVEALEKGDPEEADRAIRKHIRSYAS